MSSDLQRASHLMGVHACKCHTLIFHTRFIFHHHEIIVLQEHGTRQNLALGCFPALLSFGLGIPPPELEASRAPRPAMLYNLPVHTFYTWFLGTSL